MEGLEMLIIKIVNDGTGDVEIGNYKYVVCVNETVIDGGMVRDHRRKLGWEDLVIQLATESKEQKYRNAMKIIAEGKDAS
jgi:phosphopantetheine adenylyltransferase